MSTAVLSGKSRHFINNDKSVNKVQVKKISYKASAKRTFLDRSAAQRGKDQLNGSNGEWTNADDVKGSVTQTRRQAKMQSIANTVKQIGKEAAKTAVRSALKEAGVVVGTMVGGPKGAVVGGILGSKLSRVIGSGDYVASGDLGTVTNSLFRAPAQVTSTFSKGGSVRVRHREFIKNVVSDGTSFKNDSIFVQPGLYESFPYLAGVASNYNEYKLHGLCYEYVSTSSQYSSAVAMGSVVLAANYLVGEKAYASKSAMENSEGAISSKPSNNIIFGLECAASHAPYNRYFVRTGDTGSIPQTLEDFARFQIALCNLPTATYPTGTVVGELWVTYDIEFFVMDLPTLLPGIYAVQRSGIDANNPLGTATVTANYQGLCYNVSTTSSRNLSFLDVPIGAILAINIVWSGTAAASSPPAVAAFSGCEIYPLFSNSGVNWFTAPDGTADTTARMVALFGVRINADGAFLTMDINGTYPTTSTCWINVYSLGQGIDFTASGP